MWLGRGLRGQAHPLPGSQFKFKQILPWHKQSKETILTEEQKSEVSIPSFVPPSMVGSEDILEVPQRSTRA